MSSRTPGTPPTVREIGQRVGLSSSGSVAYQLGRLE
ncbi:LexA family protein [Streptomyces sp. NPDC005131]